jgi:guanylate kinase
MLGNIFVVSGPSGAGKTSLTRHICEHLDHINVSISHTTRDKRTSEQAGSNYHFVQKATFEKMIENDQMIEYALIYEHYYGTCKQEVEKQLNQGNDLILEVDYQGARQIKSQYPTSVSIFILPPTYETLKNRLIKRQEDSHESIDKRLKCAKNEISHYNEYDYLLINNDFDETVDRLSMVINANRFKTQKLSLLYQNQIADLLKEI